MRPSPFTLLAVAVQAVSALTTPLSRCSDFSVAISASAENFVDIPDPTTGATSSSNETVHVSGTFSINFRYCKPTEKVPRHSDVLQILVHGAGYDKNYMLYPLQPETHSYGLTANQRGYPILAYDRLGDGKSSHPDGQRVVQTSFEVAIAQEIIRKVRSGGLHPLIPAFDKVLQLGHSLGSVITANVIAASPQALDAAVFTGYSHTLGSFDIIGGLGVKAARKADPLRFSHLPESYVATSVDPITRAEAFFGPSGTFDPAVATFDNKHRQTFTWGEINTFPRMLPGPAVGFTGHILTVTGDRDSLFCADVPGCESLDIEAGSQFYPDAASAEIRRIPNAGHALNLLRSAPQTFTEILDWIDALPLSQ